ILNDPETPVSGNPKGDLTIVAFLDYNCPFCKRSEPELLRLVKADGRIRLVHKDWPILGDSSVYGAQLALAAKYQDRYGEAHAALMAIPAGNTPKERMLEAVSASGVDMIRLQGDQKAHQAEIAALLQRNLDQADALGLEGTPVFLVGPLKVAAALDYDGFRKAAAQARARSRS
ncbi:MAG: DsbA family protein, partial [Parafilimonas terrae]|nr:DsbA family protein [Parafilimonas terrae]